MKVDWQTRSLDAAVAALGSLIFLKLLFSTGWIFVRGNDYDLPIVAALVMAIACGLIVYFRSEAYGKVLREGSSVKSTTSEAYWQTFRLLWLSLMISTVLLFLAFLAICAGFAPKVSRDLIGGSSWYLKNGPDQLTTVRLFLYFFLIAAAHGVLHGARLVNADKADAD